MAANRKRPPAARGRQLTAIELPPDLVKRARLCAAAHDTTLRVLVEEGLRWRLGKMTEGRSNRWHHDDDGKGMHHER